MISCLNKLSCEYTYVKVVNFIYNIFINYNLLFYQNISIYIHVRVFTHINAHMCDDLS